MLQKVRIILKNISNKNYSELLFLQKTQWSHTSTSPGSRAGKLQKFATKLDGILMKI